MTAINNSKIVIAKNNLINKYNLDIVSKVLEKYGYDLSMRSEKIPYYVFVEISNELLK